VRDFQRIRAGLLAGLLAVAVALVAGCGSDDDGGSAPSGQASAAQEPSGTVTIWHYYDEGAGGLYDKLGPWEQSVERRYPKVKVNFEYVPYDQMTSKVTAASAAQKGPDIVLPTAPFMPEMIKAGALQPVDQYWNGFADKGQFPTQIIDSLKYNGKLYGVQAYANVVGLVYNQKILEDIGVEVPKNLDDLEAAMAKAEAADYQALTVDAPTGAGGEFNLVPWMASAGWTYDDPTNQGGLDAVRRVASWREQGYISKSDAGGFNGATNFATGKYAFAIAGNWNLGTFEKQLEFPYGVAVPEGMDRALIGGEVLSLGSNAKDPQTAWKVMEQMLALARGRARGRRRGLDPAAQGRRGGPPGQGRPLPRPLRDARLAVDRPAAAQGEREGLRRDRRRLQRADRRQALR
jgi:multiple sugar transport system substrate-binding protein